MNQTTPVPSAPLPTNDVSTTPDGVEKPKFYSKNQIDFAAFFATSFGAAYMLKRNYQALGNAEKAKEVFQQGIGLFVGIIMIFLLLPEAIGDKVPSFTIGLLYVFIAEYYFRTYQKEQIDELLASDQANVHSGWRAFGDIMICLVGVVLIVVLLAVTATVVAGALGIE